MTSKFEGFKQNQSTDVPEEPKKNNLAPAPDYFELLSAYIDGELTASERNQVQAWLDQDPKIKHLYTQLLTLQSQMQHSLAPPSNKSVADISAGVFREIDRTSHWQRRLVWGSSAIAASLLATMSGIIPGVTPFSLRMAEIKPPNTVTTNSVMLAVAVHKPAINIPKAATGYSIEIPNTTQN